tara:strand:- start:99 stop:1175 length:1077 start_codon:yes stop_codon:yes gene_type:complete
MKVIAFNIVLIAMIVVATELIFGGWIIKENNFSRACLYLLCGTEYEFHGEFTGKTRYTIDKFGLRGRKSDDSDIDMVVVGGSTTDQRYNDNTETWDQLLEDKFNKSGRSVEIVNAGINGQTTFGHIWNFKYWFPYIPNFSPKYIIFFIGFNDVPPKVSAEKYDFDVHTVKQQLRINSIFYEIYRIARGMIWADQAKIGHNLYKGSGTYNVSFDIRKIDWTSYRNKYVNKQYVPRLKELTRLSNQIGAEPIFVTQRSARWAVKNGNIVGVGNPGEHADLVLKYKGEEYVFSNADFGYAEKIISDATMYYCKEIGLNCFNGYEKMSINYKNTYDLVHTIKEGNEEIAEKLFVFLDTIIPN